MLARIPVTDSNGGRLYVEVDAVLFRAAELFWRYPDLAQHVVGLGLSDKATDKRFSPFLNLFEVVPRPTGNGGAEDYWFGYRLRAAEQAQTTIGALASEVGLSCHG
jgi:hypothetical protein